MCAQQSMNTQVKAVEILVNTCKAVWVGMKSSRLNWQSHKYLHMHMKLRSWSEVRVTPSGLCWWISAFGVLRGEIRAAVPRGIERSYFRFLTLTTRAHEGKHSGQLAPFSSSLPAFAELGCRDWPRRRLVSHISSYRKAGTANGSFG